MIWFLIAVRQEVKRIDNSVVVHALELAIKRDLWGRLCGPSVICPYANIGHTLYIVASKGSSEGMIGLCVPVMQKSN